MIHPILFLKNRLFDLNDKILNRDDQLLPFVRLKTNLLNKNINLRTADYFFENDKIFTGDYISVSILENSKSFYNDLNLSSFVIMEPPVVANYLYKKLPEITKLFKNIYLHNIDGDV